MEHTDILRFWFIESTPKQWFSNDRDFDERIRARFESIYWSVVRGETAAWRDTPQGRLAEIIVLDQFARNMFRNTPQAFLYDPLALALAEETVRAGFDQELTKEERQFLYMPYMHSESAVIHKKAEQLFRTIGGEAYEYELKHKDIVDRFGRYPHRNAILKRESTKEELDFLKTHKGF